MASNLFNRPAVRVQHPRLLGLAIVGAGVILNALNWHELTTSGRYWVMSLLLGPIAILWGLWRVAVGQPWNEATNRMERWATIGEGIVLVIGLAIAGVLFYIVNSG